MSFNPANSEAEMTEFLPRESDIGFERLGGAVQNIVDYYPKRPSVLADARFHHTGACALLFCHLHSRAGQLMLSYQTLSSRMLATTKLAVTVINSAA